MSKSIRRFSLTAAFFLLVCPVLEAGVQVQIRAVNPLDRAAMASVRYYLPSPLTANDIIGQRFITDQAAEPEPRPPVKVSYDEQKGLYLIDDEILLAPKEAVTLQVDVADVWRIPEKELAQITELIQGMHWRDPERKNGESRLAVDIAETIHTLKEQTLKDLADIKRLQKDTTVLLAGIQKHMKAYERNSEILRQVKHNMSMLENLIEYIKHERPKVPPGLEAGAPR